MSLSLEDAVVFRAGRQHRNQVDTISNQVEGDCRTSLIHAGTGRLGILASQTELLDIGQRLQQSGPHVTAIIEGHCDRHGSESYNLILGEKRAAAAKDYLRDLGIAPARLTVLSYGESRPVCTELDDRCDRLNRRAHIVLEAESLTTRH